MKKYTFTLSEINNTINKKNAANTSTIFSNNYIYTTPSSADYYSKILDDAINADIMAKNSWLNIGSPKTETIKIKLSKKPIMMSNVYEFFNGFKFGNNCPYIEDKIYYLADGTPFYFTKDYITIGFDTYYFYEFGTPSFLKGISEDFKKTIATIYVNGLKITIKK